MAKRRSPARPAAQRRPRIRVVRMVRGRAPARAGVPAGSPWTSPPEDILWACYQHSPERWPALKGLRRQVRAGRYFLDFGLAGRKLGIEVDGLQFHAGGQEQWTAHHRRHRELERLGWRVTRYTAVEASGAPVAVLDEVNRLWR